MDWIIPLLTLTAMEIVLGIDNIVFISILCGRLPESQRPRARTIGLALAMISRVLLLLSISWVLSLTNPLFLLTDLGVPESWLESESWQTATYESLHRESELQEAEREYRELRTEHTLEEINQVSVRDLILLIGGLFLIGKSVLEIHHKIEGQQETHVVKEHPSFGHVILQITLLDVIFSLDSVITAVGMAKQIWVMVLAVILAILVMMAFAGAVSDFVEKHPTVKMLALSFLILIGVLLVAEGAGTHFNKGYVYFAMAFSLIVEMLNMKLRPPLEPFVASDD